MDVSERNANNNDLLEFARATKENTVDLLLGLPIFRLPFQRQQGLKWYLFYFFCETAAKRKHLG